MIFWVQIPAFIHHMEEIVDTQSMVWIYDRLLRKGVYVCKKYHVFNFHHKYGIQTDEVYQQ